MGRPGPEARHSRRMVGSLGAATEGISGINLTTDYGDIWIEAAVASPVRPQPGLAERTAQPAAEPPPAADQPPDGYRSQLAVLQALAAGQISVEEADQLLHNLEA